MRIGLRVDVDTFRGTRFGVPNICAVLREHGITASFFFSVGPDNMGRNLWRLLRPSFLKKMLRSNATRLYGWDILLKGTFWPGPNIAEKLGSVIREAADAGHEVGLHAWDHYAWQTHLETMDGEEIYDALDRGMESLTTVTGKTPKCSAAPAWKCNDIVLAQKRDFPFDYNSDCRGSSIFFPVVAGKELSQPQIPVTLPTYDEVIERGGITDRNYNDYVLSLLKARGLNVLTIHAEVEGIGCLDIFNQFLEAAHMKGISFVPLGALLDDRTQYGRATIVPRKIPGREGWVACQAPAKHTRKSNL